MHIHTPGKLVIMTTDLIQPILELLLQIASSDNHISSF
jgi:hypothetical protein